MNESRKEFESLSRALAAREPSQMVLQECPQPHQLFDAASGALERERRLRIVDHVSQCAECMQAWRIAMELGARPVADAEQPSHAPSARMHGAKMRRFAVAASIICAIGAAAYCIFPLHHRPIAYRGMANSFAPVGQIAGSLPRDRFLLRWSAGPERSTYTLRLTTTDLAPVFLKQGLTRAEFLVPAEVLEHVAAGEALLWQVEVDLPNRQRVASETYVVTLK